MKTLLVLSVGLVLATGLTATAGTFDRRSRTEPPVTTAPGPGADPAADQVTFTRVEPILTARCVPCHSGPEPPQELRLNSYEAALDYRERARIVPGFPGASELVRRIRGQARPAMPFEQPPLPAEQIELMAAWIEQGARSAANVPAPVPAGARVRLHGTLTAQWALDDFPLLVEDGARIENDPGPGSYVEVRGLVEPDGAIRVQRLRPRGR